MADKRPVLDDVRLVSGAELLRMTDDVGFGAVGAAWVHDTPTATWHFLLVSPMIDSKGPRWVYERFLKVFDRLHLPKGITPLDIVIASPREINMQNLALLGVQNARGVPAVSTVAGSNLNGFIVDYMAVYRMGGMKSDTGDRARVFDAKVQELMAA